MGEGGSRADCDDCEAKGESGEIAKWVCTSRGWFGEPENQIAIIEKLKERGVTNVGIVYNLHHGHDHLKGTAFRSYWRKMKPARAKSEWDGERRGKERSKNCAAGQGEIWICSCWKVIRRVGGAGR